MSSNTKTTAIVVIIVLVVAVGAGIVFLGPTLFPAPAKVAIVFATGGLGDKSFNDAAYAGAQRAEDEFGWSFDYVEPEAISEYEGYLRDYADPEGRDPYELIVSIGFDQAEALNKTAKDFPNQSFCIVDMVVDQPNIASLVFSEHEGSALVGAIAGLWTETDSVGFVGGLDIPLINKFAAGYVWGANYTNEGLNYTVGYTGSWTDTTAGQNLAEGMYTAGTDVIFAAAGRSGLGVFTAAKNNNTDHNVYCIGVDSPQMYLGTEDPDDPEPPTVCITSMLKKVDVAVYETIKDVYNDEFEGGIQVFNLANGGLDYEINEDLLTLPDSIITEVETLRDKIIDGNVTVPSSIYW